MNEHVDSKTGGVDPCGVPYDDAWTDQEGTVHYRRDCHLSDRCGDCGSCTRCDGCYCYCYEDDQW